MSERQMRFRLGLFVLAAIFMLASLVVWFGAFPTLFRMGTTYTVRFPEATGVGPGTPVRRSGVRIGEVRSVALDEEAGDVKVVVAIDPPNRVRRSDVPTVTTGLLGTDSTIDFVPAQAEEGKPPPDRTPVPPGSELVGARTATVSTLLSRATDIVPTTQETLNDMRKSLQRLEKMSPLMEDALKEVRDLSKVMRESVPDARKALDDAAAASRNVGKLAERIDVLVQSNQDKIVRSIELFNDAAQRAASLLSDENQRAINAIIRNARRASDSFESIAVNVEQATKDGKEAIKEGREAMTEAKETMKSAREAMTEGKEAVKEGRESVRRFNLLLNRVEDILKNLQEITRPLAERSNNMVKNADESLEKLNRTVGDANALFRVLDQSDGTFRRLLTDPNLYNRVDDVLCGVQKMLPRFERILKDMETFADKLARHPESLGLGGVVRPGTGLKEPPTPPGGYIGPR